MFKNSLKYIVLAIGLGFVFSVPLYDFFVIDVDAQTTSGTNPSTMATPPRPIGTPPPLLVEDDEIIKIDTELVNLDVRVVDRANRPIVDLSQADFEVREDGIVQPIRFFSKSEVPTNYMLVIDNSGSLRLQLEKVIEASKMIVKTNRPQDKTGVIRFVSRQDIELKQDFTSDREDIYYALDNMFIDGGSTAIVDAVYLATERVDKYAMAENRTYRKRKAIILVSDGEDRKSYYNMDSLFKRLRESEVQIFTVGFIDDLDSERGFVRKSEKEKAREFMSNLAVKTGGKAYFPKSVAELPRIANDIANEMRTQYSIGYEPTNAKFDGSFRDIKVYVRNGPGNEKRIPVYKTGRTAKAESGSAPRLQ